MGLTVRLYEKSRFPGGRLAARHTRWGSVDLGAQFFTVRNERFRHFLNQYAGRDSFSLWTRKLMRQKGDGESEAFHLDQRYVGTPSMSSLGLALGRHLDIQFATPIDSLHRDDEGLWLADRQGKMHGPHGGLILTMPPAQAAHILTGYEGLREMLAGYHMLPCWAAAFRFEQALPLDFGAMETAHPLLAWVACDSGKPLRHHKGQWWVVHSRPDWSSRHLSLGRRQAGVRLLESFQEHFAVDATPTTIETHRWLFAKPDNSAGPGHLWDDPNNIGLCGDYLEGGRVEGAFNSAESLLSHLRVRGRLGEPPH